MARIQGETPAQTKQPVTSRWRALADRTLPLRYPLLVLVVLVLVSTGQLIEDALDTPNLEMVPPSISIPRWTLILLTLYMLLMLRVIQRMAVRTLREIRPAVKVDDQTFEKYRARMTRIHIRTDLLLALVAVAIVVLLFPILNVPLPVTRNPLTNALTFLPSEQPDALFVLIAYSLVGWAGLSLVVNTVRLGKALGDLTYQPLVINVFNNENVLPLGRLALVLSLAPAGVVLILLIGLGMPTGFIPWSVVLLASLASLLALILPLRGVHQQMSHAKNATLADLNSHLREIYRAVQNADALDTARAAEFAHRTTTLVNLRKIVQEGPTWPFHDTVAITRALLVASAPILYTIVNELIRIFILMPLSR